MQKWLMAARKGLWAFHLGFSNGQIEPTSDRNLSILN